MSHMISKSGPIALAILLAATIGATEAGAATKPGTPAHTKQQHANMAGGQHKAMMKKMPAMHSGGMTGAAMRVATAPPKQAGSCGTYMYWKAGACLDARNKK
jgi:hypothetical protein